MIQYKGNEKLPYYFYNALGEYDYIGKMTETEIPVYLIFKRQQYRVLFNFNDTGGWRVSVSFVLMNLPYFG